MGSPGFSGGSVNEVGDVETDVDVEMTVLGPHPVQHDSAGGGSRVDRTDAAATEETGPAYEQMLAGSGRRLAALESGRGVGRSGLGGRSVEVSAVAGWGVDAAAGEVGAGQVIKVEPDPLPLVALPDRWVEREDPDQASALFRLERAVHDVDTDQLVFEPRHDEVGAVQQLLVRHPMVPDSAHDRVFPLRDPRDPLRRVHPDYADADGSSVAALVRVLDVTARHSDGAGMTGEVRTELQVLIANSRSNAGAEQTLLSTRTETRRITAEDAIPSHEAMLIGQYGLFVSANTNPDELGSARGHILGVYMGALLRGDDDHDVVEALQPRYLDYLMQTGDGDGDLRSISAAGAANGVAFANTALHRNGRGYDHNRINAEFFGFTVTLTDRHGRAREENIVVLAGNERLRPGDQVRVDYGRDYLELFGIKGGKPRTKARTTTTVKLEPQE